MSTAATKRVVIADDESIMRMDLRERLTELGYLVVGEATNGQAAVTLARQTRPTIVLMDVKMEEGDGLAAAKELTEEDIAPVLLITAYSQDNLINQARKAGVAGYLVKPIADGALEPAIEIALARAGERRALRAENAALTQTLETRKLVDRAKGILMETHGLTEALAFRRIQKLSMDTRKSMKAVAEAIVLAHQIGGPATMEDPAAPSTIS